MSFKLKGKQFFKRIILLFSASILLSFLYYFSLSQFLIFGENAKIKSNTDSLESFLTKAEEDLELLQSAVYSLEYRDRKIYKSIFGSYPVELESDFAKDTNAVDLENVIKRANRVKKMIDTIYQALDYLGASTTNIPSKVPLEKFSINQIGASQGKKINPFYKSVIAHNGLDIVANSGANVIAPADGVVESSSLREDRSRGKVLTIDHLNGYKTRYTNLGEIIVRKGVKIKQGDIIAKIGSTGMSLAPHLHYEIIFKGRYMNPVHYLFSDINHYNYNLAITISENSGQSLD